MKGTSIVALLLIIGVVGYAGNIGGFADMVNGIFSGTGATPPGDTPAGPTGCPDRQVTPSLDPNAYDFENRNTAFTEAENVWRVKGSTSWTEFTQGGAFTPPLDVYIEVLFGSATDDMTDNAYGPYLSNVWTGCDENVIGWNNGASDVALYDDCVEGSITATFYNTNHDASAEAMGAGETATVYLKFEADNENYFGNPYLPSQYPNILCLDLNTTEQDEPNWVKVNGVQMAEVSTPLRHSASTGDKAYCYAAPIVDDAGVEFAVNLDADDSIDPAGDDTAYLYAASYFIHTEDASVQWGVENDQGTAVGTDAADSLSINLS